MKVTETEHALAFMDLFPASPGHTLVIPKLHYENLFEATPESLPSRASARPPRRARDQVGARNPTV